MGSSDASFEKLKHILSTNFIIITGGHSKENDLLLIFPDQPLAGHMTPDDLHVVASYLLRLLGLYGASSYLAIADRRHSKWNSLKAVFALLSQDSLCECVSDVIVLQPMGLLQKLMKQKVKDFTQQFSSLKITFSDDVSQLLKSVDTQDLTKELNGSLTFDYNSWNQQQIVVEGLLVEARQIADTYNSIIQQLTSYEYKDKTGTELETFIKVQTKQQNDVENRAKNILQQAEDIIRELRQQEQRTTNMNVVIALLDRLIVQLTETGSMFSRVSCQCQTQITKHHQEINFLQKFCKIQQTCLQHLDHLKSLTDLGDCIEQVNDLQLQLSQFETFSKDDFAEAERLHQSWLEFLCPVCNGQNIDNDTDETDTCGHDVFDVTDSVQPELSQLQNICKKYTEQLRNRYELLDTSANLHNKIDKAKCWCSTGFTVLAEIDLEKLSSDDIIMEAFEKVDNLMEAGIELDLDDPKRFRRLYNRVLTPTIKLKAQEVLADMETINESCSKLRNQLMLVKPTARRMSGADKLGQQLHNQVRQISSSLSYSGTIIKKRGFVAKEIFDTEENYVSELKSIIEGYMPQFNQCDAPSLLRENQSVVFGNIKDIYEFHSNIFLPELRQCESNSDVNLLIAKCFLSHEDSFNLYSVYCQNKMASDEILKQFGEHSSFLQGIQWSLGHRLPLSAYLLKPIQRITKYQLLLKEMLKYCAPGEEKEQLQRALLVMLDVLKYVNNLMHQTKITGYQGQFTEFGRLLLQGPLILWVDGRKVRIKEQSFKPRTMQIFLYEKFLMCCKMDEVTEQEEYQFRRLLNMDTVGLTEMPSKASEVSFEMWTKNRSEVWCFKAPSLEVKDEWLSEIKKLLMKQFSRIKDNHSKSVPLVDIAS